MKNYSYLLIWVILSGVGLGACSLDGSSPDSPVTPALFQNGGPYPPPPSGDGEPPYPPLPQADFTLDINDLTATNVIVPQPEPGLAAISGTLYSFTISQLIPETLFYLTPADTFEEETPPFLIGPQPEKGDITGTSDINGQFQLNNIPAGNYMLVVWAPYNWSIAQNSEFDTSPRTITLTENQQLSLGLIVLSWP